MAVQGGSGWMCKLMKDKEACEYTKKHKKEIPRPERGMNSKERKLKEKTCAKNA